MITIGVDSHNQVHVAVAVDEHGRPLETWQGPNSEAAWQDVLTWAGQWERRQWGIERTGGERACPALGDGGGDGLTQ